MSVYGKPRLPGEDMSTVGIPAEPSSPAPIGQPPADGGPRLPELPDWLRQRTVQIALGAVALLILVTGVTAAYAYAGDVPRGTTVLGADLGGKSRAQATEALRAELARRGVDARLSVKVGDEQGTIKPADVGLAVDVPATVDAAAAASPGPLGLLFGSRSVDPVVTVDAARLDARLRQILGKAGQAMTMPAIRFSGTTPKPIYPAPGYDLHPDRSAEAVRAGWLGGGSVEVPVVEFNPATSREDVDRLLAEVARPAVAAGVTVTTDQGRLTISPTAIAKSLLLTADRTGRITPRVDEKKLRAAIEGQLPQVEVEPRDATYTIAGGRPKVVPSVAGQQLDTAALSRDLLPVLGRSDDRVVPGKLTPVKPKTSTDDLGKLGIKERVSTFTTRFTGGLSTARSQNIVQIAREVDGALVLPGETFSLNGHTGARGLEQGYQEAPVIVDGKLVPGVGGGASQFTTTLFNATYYAGLEDVQHKPHSFYFSRYPPVIESTIFYPDLDFKFRNDSPHGVLLDTSWTDSTITVSVWSTRVYDSVTTEWSARRDIVQPKTVYLPPGPDCIEAAGSQGFAQDAWRIFRKGGTVVKREKFSWRYDPEPIFVCGPPPR
ncbi:MAG TPA: VanW family protein [Micromonosporaceae bacterium]|nr:VanW family protein [Micromonosporaceae bacterium]